MTDKLLRKLKQSKGEILVKADGQVMIKVAGEEHLLDQIKHKDQANIYAEGVQLALGYFIDYHPEIKMEG
ncbi:hypothetical protein ACOMCU_16330 [Lysinibacillus sp. UGB7]|uniref:hypothetical protein n=1 Tax=Lysinibacillus sp. UGB7 TaxID=3411039 RepID=UPI003B80839D